MEIEARLICVLSSRLGIKHQETREFLKFAARMAAGFHDIGKAHPYYVDRNRDKIRAECPFDGDCGKCEKNRPSFGEHELVSAWVVKEYLDKLQLRLTSHFELINSIAWLAVVHHHQGMRAVGGRDVKLKKWNPLNDENTESIVKRLLENALRGVSLFPLNEILDELREIEISFRGDIGRSLPSTPLLKLYALIAGPLMICDNFVASYNRKGGYMRPLLKEVLEVYFKNHVSEKNIVC